MPTDFENQLNSFHQSIVNRNKNKQLYEKTLLLALEFVRLIHRAWKNKSPLDGNAADIYEKLLQVADQVAQQGKYASDAAPYERMQHLLERTVCESYVITNTPMPETVANIHAISTQDKLTFALDHLDLSSYFTANLLMRYLASEEKEEWHLAEDIAGRIIAVATSLNHLLLAKSALEKCPRISRQPYLARVRSYPMAYLLVCHQNTEAITTYTTENNRYVRLLLADEADVIESAAAYEQSLSSNITVAISPERVKLTQTENRHYVNLFTLAGLKILEALHTQSIKRIDCSELEKSGVLKIKLNREDGRRGDGDNLSLMSAATTMSAATSVAPSEAASTTSARRAGVIDRHQQPIDFPEIYKKLPFAWKSLFLLTLAFSYINKPELIEIYNKLDKAEKLKNIILVYMLANQDDFKSYLKKAQTNLPSLNTSPEEGQLQQLLDEMPTCEFDTLGLLPDQIIYLIVTMRRPEVPNSTYFMPRVKITNLSNGTSIIPQYGYVLSTLFKVSTQLVEDYIIFVMDELALLRLKETTPNRVVVVAPESEQQQSDNGHQLEHRDNSDNASMQEQPIVDDGLPVSDYTCVPQEDSSAVVDAHQQPITQQPGKQSITASQPTHLHDTNRRSQPSGGGLFGCCGGDNQENPYDENTPLTAAHSRA